MKSPALAVFLVALMATSGCIGLADDDKEEYELVEIDLGDITKRSIGSPDLEIYSDCLELENCTQNQHRRGSKNQPIASRRRAVLLGRWNMDGRFSRDGDG